MRKGDDPLLGAASAPNGDGARHEDVPQAIPAAARPAAPPVAKRRGRPHRLLAEVSDTFRASPVLSLILLLLALGLVPSLVWAAWPAEQDERVRRPDPRYASQSGSATRTRANHIAARGDEDVDSAVETCGGIGLDHLASKYGMEPDPERVASRFAREYELAFRARVREGCLHGLLHGG